MSGGASVPRNKSTHCTFVFTVAIHIKYIFCELKSAISRDRTIMTVYIEVYVRFGRNPNSKVMRL